MKKTITYLKYINIALVFCWATYLLVACADKADSPNPARTSNLSNGGQGGSLARFAIVNNYLYAVGNRNLRVFDISTPTTPKLGVDMQLDNWGIETIFPFNQMLLIGSTTGVHAYDISQPANPTYLDRLEHMQSCDPVVAQGNYAYVTLRGGNVCGNVNSQLDVLDISDVRNIKLVNSYPMTSPYGVGVDGDFLFVCEGDSGLKVFNKTNPLALKLTSHFTNVHAYDVIPLNGLLMLIGNDGLFQYRYNNNELTAVSTIPVVNQ